MDIPLTSVFQCARTILFETGDPLYPVAANGTGFIVKYRDRMFVVTASHVVKGFRLDQIRIQYNPNSSNFLPLLRPYTIQGDDNNDTDQYDIVVLAIDESKLESSLFESYLPYDLLEMDALTIFSRNSIFAIRGFPTYLREMTYEEQAAKLESLSIDALYEGPTNSTEIHKLKINQSENIESLDGMSGSPVFQINHDGPRNSIVAFAGMLLRGTASAGSAYFLVHGKIISVLTKIIDGDFA